MSASFLIVLNVFILLYFHVRGRVVEATVKLHLNTMFFFFLFHPFQLHFFLPHSFFLDFFFHYFYCSFQSLSLLFPLHHPPHNPLFTFSMISLPHSHHLHTHLSKSLLSFFSNLFFKISSFILLQFSHFSTLLHAFQSKRTQYNTIQKRILL